MTNPMRILACAVFLGAMAAGAPAMAAQQVLTYRVEHPTYGDIGTYTNVVDRVGNTTRVQSTLHVAVKILGIVMFRQDAERTESWQGDRMTSFHGVTETNGDKVEVSGEAKGDGFVVTSPNGTVVAPADVRPSNPWSEMVLHSSIMMSTKTGKLIPVRVSNGGEQNVTFDGNSMRVHQFEIHGDKHEYVWLDNSGVPVAFRTEEKGRPVDFVLARQLSSL